MQLLFQEASKVANQSQLNPVDAMLHGEKRRQKHRKTLRSPEKHKQLVKQLNVPAEFEGKCTV